MKKEDYCKLCGERLDKNEDTALYYCIKCTKMLEKKYR